MATGSVERLVSTLSLHHWADPPAILRELHRVLHPSGAVILYDVRFSYSPRQFAAFVADGPFAPDGSSHRLARLGPVPIALFMRHELTRHRPLIGDEGLA